MFSQVTIGDKAAQPNSTTERASREYSVAVLCKAKWLTAQVRAVLRCVASNARSSA